MSFPLDRLVTKNQMAEDIFVVVSFRKENKPGCPLFKKNDNKNFWLIFD